MKKILYLDMDNVLVDFPSALAKIDAQVQKDYAGSLDDIPGIFALMEPMEGAVEAFHNLCDYFDVYILSTAPWKNPGAWSDKLEWVKKHLGDNAYKRLILTHHKELNKGDYLVDDRPNNGADRFEGNLITFASPEYPDWKAVVNYLYRDSAAKEVDLIVDDDWPGAQFYRAGLRLIYFRFDEDDTIAAFKYDWKTKEFVSGVEYIREVYFGRGEVSALEPDEFTEELATLREKVSFKELEYDPEDDEKRRLEFPDFKDPARIVEKAMENYGGHLEYVMDVLREDFHFDTFEELALAFASCQDNDETVCVLDRFSWPFESGYSDVIINVRMPKGVIAETRLHLKSIWNLYDEHNRIVSETITPIINKAQAENRQLDREECAFVYACLIDLNSMYDEAKQKAGCPIDDDGE